MTSDLPVIRVSRPAKARLLEIQQEIRLRTGWKVSVPQIVDRLVERAEVIEQLLERQP